MWLDSFLFAFRAVDFRLWGLLFYFSEVSNLALLSNGLTFPIFAFTSL